MPDRGVLSRSVHGLKHQQDGMAIVGIEKLLLGAEARHVVRQQFLVMLLRFVDGIDQCRPFLELDVVTLPHAKVL
jgi:hypothetical protein